MKLKPIFDTTWLQGDLDLYGRINPGNIDYETDDINIDDQDNLDIVTDNIERPIESKMDNMLLVLRKQFDDGSLKIL